MMCKTCSFEWPGLVVYKCVSFSVSGSKFSVDDVVDVYYQQFTECDQGY